MHHLKTSSGYIFYDPLKIYNKFMYEIKSYLNIRLQCYKIYYSTLLELYAFLRVFFECYYILYKYLYNTVNILYIV